MTKVILITGGGGFIGRNLIKYLNQNETDNKIKIIVVDNFTSSDRDEFYKFIKDHRNIILYDMDISNMSFNYELESFIRGTKIDYIYHLASIASPPLYKMLPLETLDTNYIGTKNVLELAKRHDSKLLYASTSEVYGDPSISPQHEDYYGNVNSFGDRACYDISKRIGETLCYNYIQKFGLNIKIARIFNTYGPGMKLDDGRIITETIRHLINNTEMTIYGDGNQTRSCCYIDDTLDMLVKLMESDCNIPVNIGNNQELTVNEIVDIIEKVYQKYINHNAKLNKKYIPLTQNDPLKRRPCLKRNNEILGERDYVSIEDGILFTIRYFNS